MADGEEVEFIGVREFARRVGVSASAVSQAIKAGRIKVNEGGKLEWPKAREDFESNRVRVASDVSADDYYTHRAETERWRAKLLELDYEQRSGALISREESERENFRLGRALRDSLFAVPDRVAAPVAAETDSRVVHAQILGELRASFESILQLPEDPAEFLNAIYTPEDCAAYLTMNPEARAAVTELLSSTLAPTRKKFANKSRAKSAKKKARGKRS